jgi:hypothetical protein
VSSFSYGKLANPAIINNGHTLQVALPADFKSDVLIPIRGELLSLQPWLPSCTNDSEPAMLLLNVLSSRAVRGLAP